MERWCWRTTHKTEVLRHIGGVTRGCLPSCACRKVLMTPPQLKHVGLSLTSPVAGRNRRGAFRVSKIQCHHPNAVAGGGFPKFTTLRNHVSNRDSTPACSPGHVVRSAQAPRRTISKQRFESEETNRTSGPFIVYTPHFCDTLLLPR